MYFYVCSYVPIRWLGWNSSLTNQFNFYSIHPEINDPNWNFDFNPIYFPFFLDLWWFFHIFLRKSNSVCTAIRLEINQTFCAHILNFIITNDMSSSELFFQYCILRIFLKYSKAIPSRPNFSLSICISIISSLQLTPWSSHFFYLLYLLGILHALAKSGSQAIKVLFLFFSGLPSTPLTLSPCLFSCGWGLTLGFKPPWNASLSI